MKRILSIAALLLIATASMANAPKPEPKPEPQGEGEGNNCVEYTIECGNGGGSSGKICGRKNAKEVVDDVIAIKEE